MDFNKTLSKILGNDKKFNKVQIDYRVIEEIVKIARNADPKEYVALLSGKIDEEILKVTGLIFLPFEASENSAVMQVFMMPISTDAVGSIHSHPGPSAMPSNADLIFFGKNGYFHMIICQPYTENTIGSYDAFGNPLAYEVVDLGDEIELKEWDELDIDEELFDEEMLKELEALEKMETKPNSPSNNVITSTTNKKVEAEVVNDNKKPEMEETNMNKNNEDNNKSKKPAMVNIELNVGGKKINKVLPIPPEFEEGDELIVDVRTDRTPGDSIDEILLKVKKNPRNLQAIEVTGDVSDKSSEEIQNEIELMEQDIQRLKEENERLRKNM